MGNGNWDFPARVESSKQKRWVVSCGVLEEGSEAKQIKIDFKVEAELIVSDDVASFEK